MPVRVLVQLLGDLLLAVAALSAALAMRPLQFGPDGELYQLSATAVVVFIASVLFSSFLMDVYDGTVKPRKREVFIRVVLAGMAACLPFSIVYALTPWLLPVKETLLLALFLFAAGQFCLHTAFGYVRLPQRILVLGTGPLAIQVGEIALTSCSPSLVVGYVSCGAETASIARKDEKTSVSVHAGQPKAEPVVGDAALLPQLAEEYRADALVVALSERRGVFPVSEVLQCKMRGVEILDTPTFYERSHKKLLLEQINPSWFFFSGGFRRTALFVVIKRFLDIVLSLLGLVITLPFFPIIALLIKVDSPGPLFFKQIRTGFNERTFVLYKFRTMRQDAELATGAVWSTENDPRITRIGVFLRTSRIDELPQFFNVLRGDMSFVGPRPERPEFVEKLKQVIPYYSKRHFVKPGLTGWAQVCYPYGASVEDAVEKLRYDLYYTKNLSAFLDLLIVLETIKVVLFGRGGR